MDKKNYKELIKIVKDQTLIHEVTQCLFENSKEKNNIYKPSILYLKEDRKMRETLQKYLPDELIKISWKIKTTQP